MTEILYDDGGMWVEAQVGRDTVNAKYFKSSFNHTPIKWSTWDKITIPFYRASRIIKDAYWNIRYGFQRMFKGYDSVDCFDTFEKFIERYTKILTEFKKHNHSYPLGMTEEEWLNIIDEMIYHLHYMNEDNVDKELKKYVPEGWIPCCKTSGKIMDKHKEKFFELFSKYFYNLWD